MTRTVTVFADPERLTLHDAGTQVVRRSGTPVSRTVPARGC